jgi:hypothetical protein
MYGDGNLHFYYSLADRLNMRVGDVLDMTLAEINGWLVYFETMSDGK